MKLEDHPTVRRLSGRIQGAQEQQQAETVLNGAWLRRLARDCGADDAGLVEIERPGLDPQREEILRNYPWTKSLLSLVVRMAREPVRGAPRSVANLEFHRAGHQVNEISAAVVAFGPSILRWGSPWRCIRPRVMPSGLSRTSPSRSRPGSVTWAFTAT